MSYKQYSIIDNCGRKIAYFMPDRGWCSSMSGTEGSIVKMATARNWAQSEEEALIQGEKLVSILNQALNIKFFLKTNIKTY